MALFKSRNNRRPSSTSYASTITTLVLIVISVLGLWMLTSNTIGPPQTHSTVTRTAIDTSATHDDFSSSVDSAETTTGSHDQKVTREYGDNPGHLPEDAIKFDDKTLNSHVNEEPHKEESYISEAQLSEESTLTQKQQASETNEADADNYHQHADKKMSESEKVQRSSITEASEGNQKDVEDNGRAQDQNLDTVENKNTEDQNVSAGDYQELNAGEQQDVKNLDNHDVEEKARAQDENSDTKENRNAEHQNVNAAENKELNAGQQQDVKDFDNQDVEENARAQDENSDTKENKNQENQNVNAGENREIDAGQQQDVKNFDNQEYKNDEDEQNKKQLREDKGEIKVEDEKQEDQKQDENSNSYFESEIHSTSKPSQLETHAALEGESSQLTQTEVEQKEIQKPESKKKKRQMGGDKIANQSKGSKSLSKGSKKSWSTQADQSQNQKERQKDESDTTESESMQDYTWHLCNVTAGADYIPCLDNEKALKQLRSTKHYEHRERHCPEDAPTCLVPLPKSYKRPIEWPGSRDKIWFNNVPHTLLAEVKGHQNWVKVTGEFLTFPGGGTQFLHGALHYIDFVQQAEPGIAWGKRTRVILDVGCGVGSFGGYLFERDVLAMSFAPKDEHVAQVQFALERGIPAISAVMGSQRLPFPSRVFDLVHCARCRVPWHVEGGKLLLELNRVLRPGGYFVWSATPVYQKLEEDVQIWNEMSSLTKSICWELVTISKDKLNNVGAAIYRKPTSNECYEQRQENSPPICNDHDDPNAAWYVPLQACLHRVPVGKDERGTRWPEAWPNRLHKAPYWLNDLEVGIYGKPASQDFVADTERWKNVVDELSNIGITWSNVRNVMDMRAVYGGFAAALRDLPVWVFNVVNVDSPDTLPIIYERGLFGIYHDWCESFSTYPRTYDLLHADSLFSKLKKRCSLVPVIAEVDRIVRPGGKLIVRDESDTIGEVENLLKSLHWEITLYKNQEDLLCAKKGMWRPDSYLGVS